jgi:hypothetical protein
MVAKRVFFESHWILKGGPKTPFLDDEVEKLRKKGAKGAF